MSNDLQKIVLVIIVGLLVIFIFARPKEEINPIIIEKPTYYEDLEKIHGLEKIIQEKDDQIDILKQNIGNIKEVLIIQKEELKLLEPDSGVLVLRNLLEEYTNEPCDTLPTLIDDSLVVIDSVDLFNINCVFLDHKADQKIIKEQENIIILDSMKCKDYESIIETHETIRTNLESALVSQKQLTLTWKIIGITGIALSTVLILLNL